MEMTTKLVGSRFRKHAEAILAEADNDTPISLIREPENPHDSHAVAVYVSGSHVGYIPRQDAPAIAEALDKGLTVTAVFHPIPPTLHISWEL